MKAVDPTIVIVGGVASTAHDVVANNWADTPNLSRYLISAREAGADTLSYHWYTDCNATDYTNLFTWSWTDLMTAWQNSYSRSWGEIAPERVDLEIIKPSGQDLKQGITELNTDACDFGRAPQNGNHIAALWYADALGRLAYNGLDFLTWYMGYGNGSSGYPAVVVDQDNPTSIRQIYLRPTFITLFMYGNFFGNQMVQVSGPRSETTSVWAATDSDNPGTLTLMAINLYPAQTTISVQLSGFTAAGGDKYELTSSAALDRTEISNGPDHASAINGFKLLSTNIATAKTRIPKQAAAVTGNTVTTALAPYSLTAIVLHSSQGAIPAAPASQRNSRFHGR
jgi:hypothetical protein